MSYQFYLILHLTGIFMLFSALGGMAVHAMNGGTKETNSARKMLAIFHGVGLLFMLVSGFGLLARINGDDMSLPPWIHIKLTIWLLLGSVVSLFYRKAEMSRWWYLLVLVLGIAAAATAVYKPFVG